MNQAEIPELFKHKGQSVYLAELRNEKGTVVKVSNLGAIVQSWKLQTKNGPVDVVLGFDDMQGYLNPVYLSTGTYLGAVVGRYANRIANASFKIGDTGYKVSQNQPPNQLHGGFEGFDRKVWTLERYDSENAILELSYLSVDGEEGFPGNLKVNIRFELTEQNELKINTNAITDKACPVNLTHHDYFNLNGSGNIGDHFLEIPSDRVLTKNETNATNGDFTMVAGNTFDFRTARRINELWDDTQGYDHSFVINKQYGSYGLAASAYSDKTGLRLDVFTDEPTVHLYTGKYLRLIGGKDGSEYPAFTGFCLETQHHANAVNIPDFPSTILQPGETYQHQTVYQLSNQEI